MNSLHFKLIWRVPSFITVLRASFFAWTSTSTSRSWLSNKAGRARSFNSLDINIWRGFKLISVITLIKFLFMLESFIDLDTYVLVYFSDELLLLSCLLDSLLHKTKSLRDDLSVEFQLNLFSFNSIIDFRNFDWEKVHHVVIPHNLLMLLSQLMIQIPYFIQFCIKLFEFISELLFIFFSFIF